MIDYAIAKGADLNQIDRNGLTPLLLVAIRADSNPDIFQLIRSQIYQPISRLDKIIGFELMGATRFNNGEQKQGLCFWKIAMTLRFSVPNEPPIPKPHVALTDSFRALFQDAAEMCNLEEMKNLRLLEHSMLVKQAHQVYIHILGMNNTETIRILYTYAFSIWDMGTFFELFDTHYRK